VKQSVKVMVWGSMTGRRLKKVHMLPTGENLNFLAQHLHQPNTEKEVTSRHQVA